MVYGICYWPLSYEEENPELMKKFIDSKQTTEEQREKTYQLLKELNDQGKLGFKIHSLSPVLISNEMLGDGRNLNRISHDTAIGLIEETIKEGNNITEVYVDTVGVAESYQNML